MTGAYKHPFTTAVSHIQHSETLSSTSKPVQSQLSSSASKCPCHQPQASPNSPSSLLLLVTTPGARQPPSRNSILPAAPTSSPAPLPPSSVSFKSSALRPLSLSSPAVAGSIRASPPPLRRSSTQASRSSRPCTGALGHITSPGRCTMGSSPLGSRLRQGFLSRSLRRVSSTPIMVVESERLCWGV